MNFIKRKNWTKDLEANGNIQIFIADLALSILLIPLAFFVGATTESILWTIISIYVGFKIIDVFFLGPLKTTMVLVEISKNIEEIKNSLYKTEETQYNTTIFNDETKQREKDGEKLKNGGWRCSECNKINASYIGTCSCGNCKK